MNDIMRSVNWLMLITSGICGSFLWCSMSMPPKGPKSQRAKFQAMIKHDENCKFIFWMIFIMDLGLFFFSFVSLLSAS